MENQPWYHGPLSRAAAEHRLTSGIDGSFLVRESESNKGEHSLSVRFDGKPYHYRIMCEGGKYFVAKDIAFNTLAELLQHHSTVPDGLITVLKFPLPKKDRPTIYGLGHGVDKWEIDRSEIELKSRLGGGQYGDVYEGIWKKKTKVAVKTLKDSSSDMKEFLGEARIMKNLKHDNLVQLLGVCTQDQPFFIGASAGFWPGARSAANSSPRLCSHGVHEQGEFAGLLAQL